MKLCSITLCATLPVHGYAQDHIVYVYIYINGHWIVDRWGAALAFRVQRALWIIRAFQALPTLGGLLAFWIFRAFGTVRALRIQRFL